MHISRRQFIGGAAATASLAWWGRLPEVRAQDGSARKLRVAQIGCGGRGAALFGMWRNEELVAAVDTNRRAVDQFNPDRFPKLGRYTDYRTMYENHMDEIDAVIVATPDHQHFPAAMLALRAGKAVYCEKPLAWSMSECFALARIVEARQRPSQMGNQGNGGAGWREIYSIVHQDILGPIKEVHTWTNRPIWPQGQPAPTGDHPVPDHLDWDSWIGPAPLRAYHPEIEPFKWRGYYDYGCGALGDMACHTMNAIFQTLKPGYDCTVEPLRVEGRSEHLFPAKEIIKWVFAPTSDGPGFDAYWYDGGLKPEKPAALGAHDLPNTGSMFIGTKGVLISHGDYNDGNAVYIDGQQVQPSFEPLPTPPARDIQAEFVQAAKGELAWDATISNFMYAGKMSAIIAMGPIAERVDKKITFSSETMRFDDDAANRLMHRPPREGWEKAYTA